MVGGRAALLWRWSQPCNCLRGNPFHCSPLPCVYYTPQRKVAWEGHEMSPVGQRLEAVSGDVCCWDKHGYSHVAMGAISHALHPAQPLCVFIGSKFQTEHLFCLQVACNCLPGYSGDGVSQCNPINLCEQVCLHFTLTRSEGCSLEAFLSPTS